MWGLEGFVPEKNLILGVVKYHFRYLYNYSGDLTQWANQLSSIFGRCSLPKSTSHSKTQNLFSSLDPLLDWLSVRGTPSHLVQTCPTRCKGTAVESGRHLKLHQWITLETMLLTKVQIHYLHLNYIYYPRVLVQDSWAGALIPD
jgi:hypothetical protein